MSKIKARFFMRNLSLMLSVTLILCTHLSMVTAYVPGTIKSNLELDTLKQEILESLSDYTWYAERQFKVYTEKDENAIYFGKDGIPTEYGIRPHVNNTLIYAFMSKYLPDQTLNRLHPNLTNNGSNSNEQTREAVMNRAMQAITYALKTHKETAVYPCPKNGTDRDGKTVFNWGMIWQSSMWASKLGFACQLLWEHLDDNLKTLAKTVITKEANLIASKSPSIQKVGDTSAEENSWDTNIVSLAYNMFPDHEDTQEREKWDYTAKLYAMNSISREIDRSSSDIIDGKQIKEWVKGATIYDDYSMENHNIFHPVYQTSVLFAYADSILYYALGGNTVPQAFSHNLKATFDNVLKKIMLPTGAWVFPNGNDWSQDSLDQIDALALMSSYFQDASAKLALQRGWQHVRARQKIYFEDSSRPGYKGSYIGRGVESDNDNGQRRESIQAERVMMTYLLLEHLGGWAEEELEWNEVAVKASGKGHFINGGIVYDRNQTRFASFSWANGMYIGIVTPDSNQYLDEGFSTVPFNRNFTGQYIVPNNTAVPTVKSKSTSVTETGINATGLISARNDSIDQYISFSTLPNNAVVYMDYVKAAKNVTVTREEGIPFGFRTDEVSGETRVLSYNDDGIKNIQVSATKDREDFIPGNWVNVDGQTAMIVDGSNGIRFGDYREPNGEWRSTPSIKGAGYTILHGSYLNEEKNFTEGQVMSSRGAIVYSNIDPQTTEYLNQQSKFLQSPEGWRTALVTDVDDRVFLINANFFGASPSYVNINHPKGAPVTENDSFITGNTAASELVLETNKTQVTEITAFITAPQDKTIQAMNDITQGAIRINNPNNTSMNVQISMMKEDGTFLTQSKTLDPNTGYIAEIFDENIVMTENDYDDFSIPLKTLDATVENNGSRVRLDWTATANIFADLVIERRSLPSGDWIKLTTVPGYTTRYKDYATQPGDSYGYRMFISNKPGEYVVSGNANIPPKEAGDRINVALGKTATCFNTKGTDVTNTSGGRVLYNLTDGNDQKTSDTFWGTLQGNNTNGYPPDINPISVTIDLKNVERFRTIAVVPRVSADAKIQYGPCDFKIYVSSEEDAAALDNTHYTEVKDIKNYTAYEPSWVYDIDLGSFVSARYVRLYITKSYGNPANRTPGENVQIMEMKVYRELEPIALSSLSVTPGILSEDFSPDVTNYTLAVSQGTQKVDVLANTTNQELRVKINGEEAIETTPISVELTSQTQEIKVELLDQTDTVQKTYTIQVNAGQSKPYALSANVEMVNNQKRVVADIVNYSGSADEITAIFAIYDSEDTLLDMFVQPKVSATPENHVTKYLGILPEDCKVRVMLWDGLKNILPVSTAVVENWEFRIENLELGI